MRHWRYARRLLAAGLVILGTGLPLAGPASASSLRPTVTAPPSPVQVAELTASDSAPDNYFGDPVAITPDGNTALIGAAGNDNDPGAAYVFTRTLTGWRQTAELTATDAANDDEFGISVAIAADGHTALISAVNHDSGTGAAYVFTRTFGGWRQTAELTASDAANYTFFGKSVALTPDGNIALIGAAANNSVTGAAYVFTRTFTGWRQTAELTASDAAGDNYFGESVAIAADGHTALIGAPGRDSYKGAAYLFTRTRAGWQQTVELTGSDAAINNEFGESVAIAADGHTALIGAPFRSIGAAYLFTRTRAGWQQTAELTASDAATGNFFGGSVAVTPIGNTALIGASGSGSGGAAYLFTRTRAGWQQTAELTAIDAAHGDEFGASVAIAAVGNTSMIGSIGNNSVAGAAYVFAQPSPWW